MHRTTTTSSPAPTRLPWGQFLKNSSDAIVALGSDGRVLFINPSAERLFGRLSGDLEGKSHEKFISTSATGGVFQSGRVGITGIRPDGETFPLDASVTSAGEGEARITLIIAREVYPRESDLLERAKRMKLAQSVARLGTFEWNIPEDRLRWSAEMETLYGSPSGALPIRFEDWRVLLHPDDAMRVERAIRRSLEDHRDEIITEFRVRAPTGGYRWMEARARIEYLADGKPLRVFGVNMDVTERKRFENRLVEQAEALWRSNRELEQFAYVSSHDLTEPLRRISSFADLLSRNYARALDETGRHYLDMIESGVSRMNRLVGDLLSYSQINRRAPTPSENVPLNPLVAEVAARYEPVAALRQGRIRIGELPAVRADPNHLRQLFHNLIENAVKFTPADRPPLIDVFQEKRGASTFIGVRDNGIGIDPQYFDRIFKLFQRLNRSSDYPGTGMGLAISRKIVERYGGRIWIESDPGKGSTFFFSLPLTP